MHFLPLNPLPLPLEQAGEGDPWGLMTGAKALFCLTAGKTEEENGRMEEVLEEPTVGLEDITGKEESDSPSEMSLWKFGQGAHHISLVETLTS